MYNTMVRLGLTKNSRKKQKLNLILKNYSKEHLSEESGTNKPVKYNFPDSSMQMMRFQKETDFLKYLN